MTDWLLCDYGQVLSTAPPPDEWDTLRRLAGDRPDGEFHTSYWQHRLAYDRADLEVGAYWTAVIGETPAGPRLRELIEVDTAMWLHPHQPSVEGAVRAGARGLRLAIFSNAPLEVAAAIDGLEWLEPFEKRFYSCRLRVVKPEPEAYARVLDGLGAKAGRVTFFDDRPPNVDAARAAGIRAFLFSDAAQFDDL